MHGTAIPSEITRSLSIFHEDMRAGAVLKLFIPSREETEHNAWLCINPISVVCVCVGTFVEKETLTLLFPRLNREQTIPFPFLGSTWYKV